MVQSPRVSGISALGYSHRGFRVFIKLGVDGFRVKGLGVPQFFRVR